MFPPEGVLHQNDPSDPEFLNVITTIKVSSFEGFQKHGDSFKDSCSCFDRCCHTVTLSVVYDILDIYLVEKRRFRMPPGRLPGEDVPGMSYRQETPGFSIIVL